MRTLRKNVDFRMTLRKIPLPVNDEKKVSHWNRAKLQSKSSSKINTNSSRFSEHLRSWIKTARD